MLYALKALIYDDMLICEHICHEWFIIKIMEFSSSHFDMLNDVLILTKTLG